MASNNGYLTHCRICGTPIFSLGNRQFCSACYAQNRRNAAHRSNAEAKMRRLCWIIETVSRTVILNELSDDCSFVLRVLSVLVQSNER